MNRKSPKPSVLVYSVILLSLLFCTVPLQGKPLHSAAEPCYPPFSLVNPDGTAHQIHKKWMETIGYENERSNILVYAGDHDFYPFEFIDKKGRPAGFNIDLIRALSRQTGINIVLELTPWNQVRQKVNSGHLDIATMYYSKNRAQLLDFASPLLLNHQAVFARNDSPRYDSRDAMKNRRVAVVEGDITHDFALKQNLSSRLVPVTDPQQALALLQNGEVDYTICSMIQGNYWIRKNQWTHLHVAEPRLVSFEYCLAVPHGRTELLNLINTGLAELHASGEYRRIHTQWLSPLDNSTDWSRIRNYFIFTICIFLLVTAGVFIWIIFLKREVRKHTVALHTANQRFNIATQAGGIGVWDLNLITNQLVWDDRMYEIYGVSRNAFGGAYEAWKHCVHPDDLESADAEISAAVKGKNEYDTSLRIIRPDGEIRQIRAHANVLYNKGGHPERMVGTNQDITEQKQAEMELDKSRKMLRDVVDTSPDLMWLKDDKGVYLLCNQRFEQFFGAEKESIVGRTDYDFMPKDTADFFLENDRRAIKKGGPSMNEEELTFLSDGHVEQIETIKTPIYGHDGSLLGILGIGRDITARKQAEKALARHQATLESEVLERTKELRQVVNVMAGRENRMAELKLIIKNLCTQLEDAGITAHDSVAKDDSGESL
ncbi:MAG: transporter substrate-binding domain-containing protein [Kiritimatiellae bacterium]|jgi:PAS domain S-box-containing protein|nr:transporter substrate-binding domain-containing protein [Kiritimatiellia bacterium]